MGALVRHITGGADATTFQPMNVNFGLFPPLTTRAADGAAARIGTRAIPTAPRPILPPGSRRCSRRPEAADLARRPGGTYVR